VESAALLHDLDKALPSRDPIRELGHGHAGAEWLVRHGMAELAPPVAWHPVARLGDDETYERFLAEATWEVRVVAYADKRSLQRVVSLDARFARWERRHSSLQASLRRAMARTLTLETELCDAAGIQPSRVHRLRWVDNITAKQKQRSHAA
jgi:hypothetical protein